MSNIIKNILIGMVFFTGLLTFALGEFILSSALFAIAATAININKPPKKANCTIHADATGGVDFREA